MPEADMVHLYVEFRKGVDSIRLERTLSDPRLPKAIVNRGKSNKVNWITVEVPRTEASTVLKAVRQVTTVSTAYILSPPSTVARSS